ncbi:MAG TPA: hypothetical protein VKA27_04600 [Sunxiuqinia sp.]|nr:hypothetical protein [Sunxiuqinia sp.]
MKKLILGLFLSLFLQPTFACDLCGCNSGNYFIGPLPQFTSHFASIRYSFQKYKTVLQNDASQFSNDRYQTAELMLGTRIKNKWQLLAFIPYSKSKLESDDGINSHSGLGDITLNGNYNLFDKMTLNKDTNTVDQQLWVGAGIKLPTGKFNVDEEEIVSSANSQPGSGSVDFLVNALYTLQIKSWGLNVNANFKINQSADHFKFGNRFTPTAFLFRNFHIGALTVSPNLGMLYEHFAANVFNDEKVADTGGYNLFSSAGIELRYNRLAIGGSAQMPVSSDLSSGQTKAKGRGMLHLSLLF